MELHLSQSVDQRLEHKQELKLNKSLKQELSLRLSLDLKSPAPIEALKGLEGVNEADKILKEKQLSGILIGGVAKKVWSRTFGPEDFIRKDVDVLVFNSQKQIKFGEGGIDWWLPKEQFISYVDSNRSEIIGKQSFFTNINGAILNFKASTPVDIEPGLYLLDLEQLITMQFTESSVLIKDTNTSYDASEKFDEYYRRFYQKIPSRHMIENFDSKFIPSIDFEEVNIYLSNALKKNPTIE